MSLVTIYIPTKNRLALLKRAIKSVQDQTYKNIELIIVDDGSTDETINYLSEQMVAGNFKVIFHKTSMGACAARNTAILNSTGHYITGLDDDDYFISNDRIRQFINHWNNVGHGIGGLFDSAIVETKLNTYKRHESLVVTHKDLRENNILGNQIFAPKKHYLEAGLFDPAMPAWQDWDLWLRISNKFGSFINIHQCSYLIDEKHDADRITTHNEIKIRKAMHLFSRKIEKLTLRERSSLIIAMHRYPQVKPTAKEIIYLVLAMRIKSAFRAIRKIAS